MDILGLLEELRIKVREDKTLRLEILATKGDKNPVDAFCKVCQAWGYEIYAMDLIGAGEEFYGNMRRSTNGGGENSPMLDGEDDFYELFMASLEAI